MESATLKEGMEFQHKHTIIFHALRRVKTLLTPD